MAATPQPPAAAALPPSHLPPLRVTPLRVSTMTVTGHTGVAVDLARLFAQIDGLLVPPWWLGAGIQKMEYKQAAKGVTGPDLLATAAARPAKARKTFLNQATLVVRWPAAGAAGASAAAAEWKSVNLKLFASGGVQMTGVVDEAAGRAACDWVLARVAARCTNPPVFGPPPAAAGAAPALVRYDVQLINSDYSLGAPIRRDRLFRVLVERYGVAATLEATVYQAVNVKLFVNAARPAGAPLGVCVCPGQPCRGNGSGAAVGSCARVTVCPFQTGCVIITGARSRAQLDEAYAFFNAVVREHAADVVRRVFAPPPAAASPAPARAAAPSWVPHPPPRQLVRVAADKVVENMPAPA
jgi:hypothetical protein